MALAVSLVTLAGCDPYSSNGTLVRRTPPPLVRTPCSEMTRLGAVSADGWHWIAPRPLGNPLAAAAVHEPGQAWLAGAAGTLLHVTLRGDALEPRMADLPRGVEADLYAVAAPTPVDVFAVGAEGIAVRCDGLQWRVEETGVEGTLRGIWAADPFRVFAVGDDGAVLVREADRWRPETVEGADGDLEAVFGFPESGRYFAVGSGGLILAREPEGVWRPVAERSPPRLRAVWGLSADEVYAAGDGIVLRSTPEGVYTRELEKPALRFMALWGVENRLFVAGDGGEVWTHDIGDAPRLSLLGDSAPRAVYALSGTSEDDAWRVGDAGSVGHWGGSAWRELSRGPYDHLSRLVSLEADSEGAVLLLTREGRLLRLEAPETRSVDGPDTIRWRDVIVHHGEVFVVGSSSTGLREGYVGVVRGTTVHVEHTVRDTELHTVAVVAHDEIVAAGEGRSMLRLVRGHWEEEVGPGGPGVTSMASDDAGRTYAVNLLGELLIQEAPSGSWETEPLGPDTRAAAVTGIGDGRVAIVGPLGLLVTGRHGEWIHRRIAEEDLFAIRYFRGEGDPHTAERLRAAVVGARGVAARFDGAAWNASVTGVHAALRSVAFDSSGGLWACGDHGTVVHVP